MIGWDVLSPQNQMKTCKNSSFKQVYNIARAYFSVWETIYKERRMGQWLLPSSQQCALLYLINEINNPVVILKTIGHQ